MVTTVTIRNEIWAINQAKTVDMVSVQPLNERDDAMQPVTDQMLEEAPEADTPFNQVMKTWARWMTLSDQQTSEGLSHPQDVKEFMACGEAVDLMIDTLPRVQWWAIRKAWGITTVWRFPEQSFTDALVAAELILSPKMSKNVATRQYFN
jgi:hypothetical protein